MAGSGCNSSVPSLPPPRPKSPPQYPDLYGKRRELAKVLMLEREIGFLELADNNFNQLLVDLIEELISEQEELKFVEGLPPASQSCKEIADFVVAKSDPLILMTRKKKRYCRFWKWLCRLSCVNISWLCCCGCSPRLKLPHCCDCNFCSCQSCSCNCSIPKCRCCCWPRSKCLKKSKCGLTCCIPKCLSCSDCSCKKCSFSCPRCPRVRCCCCCTKNCCNPCYFCC